MLGISDLFAEPERPTFISRTVTHRRVDRRYSRTHCGLPNVGVTWYWNYDRASSYLWANRHTLTYATLRRQVPSCEIDSGGRKWQIVTGQAFRAQRNLQ
jgi:hypothetical protein